ncbi:hypothetical protein QQS21_006912 [Conoideocrella luteorostrata]|uniref:Aspartate aminotransferase n=1 Tax=Conoideocrella luteorostrata TaxID=1105319 RepID=A0AAJ0FSJ2_9HYPO|nr:hypothetical protein QQS21_006912 [Conoideocrella luteorostrata]
MEAHQAESAFAAASYIPPDRIFELTKLYNEDQCPDKVNLGQGTYRDENGNPWVLPAVCAAKDALGSTGHEYLPIRGLQTFCDSAAKLVLHDTKALEENRVATCQALSGTGALLLAGLTIKKAQTGIDTIYIPTPTWTNHETIFQSVGFRVKEIPYYRDRAFNFGAYLSALQAANSHSAVILHACAHNPTGCDPSQDQWRQIAAVIKQNGIFPIFDAAYLGFNSGSVDEDAWAIRHLIEDLALEAAICVSFAKNMGLYGERVGLTAFVTKTPDVSRTISSILERGQRSTVSNPPAYGARIAATVLGDSRIKTQWSQDLLTMSSRIKNMRRRLHDDLVRLETPGDWSHIIQQSGMFAYTGVSSQCVNWLREKYHIYMPSTSRISIAGLTERTVTYVANAINDVVRMEIKHKST